MKRKLLDLLYKPSDADSVLEWLFGCLVTGVVILFVLVTLIQLRDKWPAILGFVIYLIMVIFFGMLGISVVRAIKRARSKANAS